MAKNKTQTAPPATPPESAEVNTPAPADPAAAPEPTEREAVLESVGIIPPSRRVYRVEIPNCLLGEKLVLAGSMDEALEKYKRPCGITSHAQPAKITVTDLKAEDVDLFGES